MFRLLFLRSKSTLQSAAGLAAAVVVLLHSASAQDTPERVFDAAQEAEIARLIRTYLLENPEVIPEAIEIWRDRQEAEEKARQKEAILAAWDELKDDGFSPVAGNPDGDVTVVEFYDYRCVFCRRAFPDLQRLLKADTNIRYVLKQFPVRDQPGAPPVSLMAAKAVMAANRQGNFLDLHNAMMTTGTPLTEAQIFALARKHGFDEGELREGMQAPVLHGAVEANFDVARRIGITGTPAYIIGGELYMGVQPLERLFELVAQARAQASNEKTSSKEDG